VPARVEIVEPLGSETHLHCVAAKKPFLVSLQGHRPLQHGDEVRFLFAPDKLHFFDPETGERLA
jgi:ABC-type sugar transport system ATPase subunit